MTLKTFSDKAKTFTFTYEFKDLDTAMVAGHALLGYMTGTYEVPSISITHKDKGTLVAEYVEDKKLKRPSSVFVTVLKTTTTNQWTMKHLRNVTNGSACFNSKSQRTLKVY